MSSLNIFCKNARLTKDEHIVQLLGELDTVEWDIVFFSETRATEQDLTVDGGHRLILYREEYLAAGVGILIHRRHACTITQKLTICDRILAVDVSIGGKFCRCIAVYCPHAGFEMKYLDEVYEKLEIVCKEAEEAGKRLLIGGDFNTVLHRGYRGLRLQEFANIFNLAIVNDPPGIE